MRSIYSSDYERIIGELAAARKQAGLTQDEVGARLGRDQSFVSKYERRDRRLDFIEFKHVCEALGLDASALLKSIDTEAADTPSTTETTK